MHRLTLLVLAAATMTSGSYDPLSVSGEWLISTYKTVISPLQGQGMCNFWPTCSQFTRQAIQHQGFLVGTVMGAERLMRCHGFAWSYYDKYYFGISHNRLNDPPANHVAWQTPTFEPRTPVIVTVDPAHPSGPIRNLATPEADPAFADHLYETGDYSRAATEYLRIRFTGPDGVACSCAGWMAAESFLQAGDYARARTTFRTNSALPGAFGSYGVARTYLAESRYAEARVELARINEPVLADKSLALTGWSLCKEHHFADAAALFRQATGITGLDELAELDGHDLPRRSRLAGSLMSAVLPGAGQVYSGRTGDGLYALLTVASTGLVTWWFAAHPEHDGTRVKLGIFGTLTALFYSAGIHGANIAARDFNRFHQRDYLARIERILYRADLEPDYRAILRHAPPDTLTGRTNPESD